MKQNKKNVLLIGKSGTGKSTLYEVLRDPLYRGDSANQLFAKTLKPDYHPLVVHDAQLQKFYSINIIDTPGLFEARLDDKDARTTTEIFSLISACMKASVTKVAAVLLVFKMNDRVSQEDISTLKEVSKFLGPELLKNTFLIFTNAEDNEPAHLKDNVTVFFQSTLVQMIAFGGIMFAGAIDSKRVKYTGYEKGAGDTVGKFRHFMINKIIELEDIGLPEEIVEKFARVVESEVADSVQTTVSSTSTSSSSSGSKRRGCLIQWSLVLLIEVN